MTHLGLLYRQFAIGWWIMFGDDSFLRVWEMIAAIHEHETGEKPETRHEFALRVFGVNILFP